MSTERILARSPSDRRIQKKVAIVLDRAIDVMVYIAVGLLVFSWLSVSADVILRYFFSRPLQWSTEITEYILLQVTFLGAAWLLRKEGHVNVDIVLTRLNPRSQAMLNLITSCICMFICIILSYFGITAVISLIQKHTIIPKQVDMPAYIVYVVIPMGYFVLFCQFIRRTWGFLSSWKSLGRNKSSINSDGVTGLSR